MPGAVASGSSKYMSAGVMLPRFPWQVERIAKALEQRIIKRGLQPKANGRFGPAAGAGHLAGSIAVPRYHAAPGHRLPQAVRRSKP